MREGSKLFQAVRCDKPQKKLGIIIKDKRPFQKPDFESYFDQYPKL